MVLALVHPLVQVYTIPRTGQLAYVGHVCNFRQLIATLFKSLPILPEDMPFVMVRPRAFRNRVSNKMPFKVNIHKLRAAFAWLKRHNPFYRHIVWDEAAAAAWCSESIVVGTTREEDLRWQSVPKSSSVGCRKRSASRIPRALDFPWAVGCWSCSSGRRKIRPAAVVGPWRVVWQPISKGQTSSEPHTRCQKHDRGRAACTWRSASGRARPGRCSIASFLRG